MKIIWCLSVALVWALALSATPSYGSLLSPPCDSLIYCHGRLLETVQLAEIFNDSKYFVDMVLKAPPQDTLRTFDNLMDTTSNNPSQKQVRNFVETNFREPGSAFVHWTPPDWKSDPDFLTNIVDPDLEDWARGLNDLWKELGKKTSHDVKMRPDRYSLIYLPHPVIVPGGRFREVYYWDSFWTLEGLLLSGMRSTAKGMLENFLHLVKTYGMVPNGGRIYYTRRSQPPYLISMVKLYVEHTGDKNFIRENIDVLAKEFEFWEDQRTTPVRDPKTQKVHRVYQYKVEVGGPRPESFKEDYKLAEDLPTENEKEQLYIELKSGAESGWDYSTRWFIKDSQHSNEGSLEDLKVTDIAPVDLNSLMCRNAKILGEFYHLIGDFNRATKYQQLASSKNQTLADLFWDAEDGVWYDVNIKTNQKRKFFYLSNVHPLWSGCYGMEGNREDTVRKVMDYLERKKVIDYAGGVPTSLKDSEEQWDFPNTWPPLQHLVVMGLHNARDIVPESEQMAFELAEKWITTNYLGYKKTNAMFEKYDATVHGVAGKGGEYKVQIGFGWTNGVAIKFLNLFGDRLSSTSGGSAKETACLYVVMLPLVIMMAIFTTKRNI